ncbi:hypothetical protein ATCC90586_004648 [Pythium insidiosum]|nr:hypothetical protein ATCC90586_004648 [Pythium insidiosum]
MTVQAPNDKIQPIVQVRVAAPKESDVAPPAVALNGKKFSYRQPTRSAPTPPAPRRYTPGRLDVWMLGITIVIGGQYFSWNAGVSAGLYSFLISVLLVGSAYVVLCACTSEITGALPFAGGAYGLARCTLGFYPAFLIGCCEALEYIVYVSTSVLSLADMLVQVHPPLDGLRPLLWALFFATALFFHLKSERVFWGFNLAIGAVSLAVVLLFCFGSLPFVSYAQHAAAADMDFVGGLHGFMKALPLACWFFVGVEALSLASDQVAQPKQVIPLAQMACVLTLAATATAVFFVTVSLPSGLAALPKELAPFNGGFQPLLRISYANATALSLPATYATAFGFMWCYGKLIAAMATSRLLPVFLSRVSDRTGAPHVAIVAGSLLSYSGCLVVYLVPSVAKSLFSICILAAFMSYTGQCVGYISLRLNYRNIKSSTFHSPFGIPGALFSMAVWAMGIVSVVGFQDNGGVEVAVFLGVVALLSLYYFAWAKKRQTFSAQENRILLVAHVMKFNGRRTAVARKRGNGNGSGSGGQSASKATHNNARNTTRYTNMETGPAVGPPSPSKSPSPSKARALKGTLQGLVRRSTSKATTRGTTKTTAAM